MKLIGPLKDKPVPKIVLSVWVGIFFSMVFANAGQTSPEVLVIVNKNQNISRITYSELRDIYMGKRKFWENGEKIVLFLPPPGSVPMDILVKKVFKKKTVAEVSKFYLKAIFQQVFPVLPRPLTAGGAVASITSNPGGITIVESSDSISVGKVNIVQLTE